MNKQKMTHNKQASITALVMGLILISTTHLSFASSKTPAKVVAGWVEKVVIEDQDYAVKAKLDTGAKTSSIHAEDIQLFERDKRKWVRFTLVLPGADQSLHRMTLEKPRARRVKVKEHDGEHDSRPVVELDICFNGFHYNAQFTLVNRQEYIYSILLGRRFLNKKAIIDPDKTFQTLAICHAPKLPTQA